MQIGSGTIDLFPRLTYFLMLNNYSIGLQAKGTLRLGKNEQGYRLGNRISATSWFSYVFALWISSSFRVEWQTWENIDGNDARIPTGNSPKSTPTAQPDLRGGSNLNLFLGLNLYLKRSLPDLRFAVEVGYTVYRDLDGPQLGRDWAVILGVQSLAFDLF